MWKTFHSFDGAILTYSTNFPRLNFHRIYKVPTLIVRGYSWWLTYIKKKKSYDHQPKEDIIHYHCTPDFCNVLAVILLYERASGRYLIADSCWYCMRDYRSRKIFITWVRYRYKYLSFKCNPANMPTDSLMGKSRISTFSSMGKYQKYRADGNSKLLRNTLTQSYNNTTPRRMVGPTTDYIHATVGSTTWNPHHTLQSSVFYSGKQYDLKH